MPYRRPSYTQVPFCWWARSSDDSICQLLVDMKNMRFAGDNTSARSADSVHCPYRLALGLEIFTTTEGWTSAQSADMAHIQHCLCVKVTSRPQHDVLTWLAASSYHHTQAVVLLELFVAYGWWLIYDGDNLPRTITTSGTWIWRWTWRRYSTSNDIPRVLLVLHVLVVLLIVLELLVLLIPLVLIVEY